MCYCTHICFPTPPNLGLSLPLKSKSNLALTIKHWVPRELSVQNTARNNAVIWAKNVTFARCGIMMTHKAMMGPALAWRVLLSALLQQGQPEFPEGFV